MIVLDTSVLIETLAAGGSRASELRRAYEEGERIVIPTLVLYEWLRGPRVQEELDAQEALLPSDEAIPFGLDEAALAAGLYRQVRHPRGREVDLAIAACAISWNAELWTLNEADFADVPGLRVRGP
jgi:predicted nucleic acid-binding protein